MDDSDDAIGAVDEKGTAIRAKAKKGDQAGADLGAVNDGSGFGLDYVDVALIGPG